MDNYPYLLLVVPQDGRAFWMLVHVLSEWAHTPALALASYLGG